MTREGVPPSLRLSPHAYICPILGPNNLKDKYKRGLKHSLSKYDKD